jgi:hypothetical protein
MSPGSAYTDVCGMSAVVDRLMLLRNGIEDQNRTTSSELLAFVNPTFSWVGFPPACQRRVILRKSRQKSATLRMPWLVCTPWRCLQMIRTMPRSSREYCRIWAASKNRNIGADWLLRSTPVCLSNTRKLLPITLQNFGWALEPTPTKLLS